MSGLSGVTAATRLDGRAAYLRGGSFVRTGFLTVGLFEKWLGDRDSNPDSQIQSLESYHWTIPQQTSQRRNPHTGAFFTRKGAATRQSSSSRRQLRSLGDRFA